MPTRKTTKQPGIVREPVSEYGTTRRLTATQAARGFSEILNRVHYRGERFLIERGGRPIGELRPAAPTRFTGRDLLSLLRSLPPIDDDYLDAVEEAARNQPSLPEPAWEP